MPVTRRTLLDFIDTSTLKGLRNRALIGVMIYTRRQDRRPSRSATGTAGLTNRCSPTWIGATETSVPERDGTDDSIRELRAIELDHMPS